MRQILCALLIAFAWATASGQHAHENAPSVGNSLAVTDSAARINGYNLSPKYGYYTPAREFTLASAPLILSGLIAKADNNVRHTQADLEPKSHNIVDRYLQYAPLAAAWGMKLCGVEGRSSWARLAVSNALSAVVMAGVTETIKKSTSELRPDGSDRKSFPSGHTATAFMAATIVHKEYGLTRSPWYSVGAYSLATATAMMRARGNRHWASDILVGAGVGIISTDLGYLIADLIFKDKGIVRNDKPVVADMYRHPSFFSASLCATKPFGELAIGDNVMQEVYKQLPLVPGLGKDNLLLPRLKLGTGTTVNAEGAYFINPYVGFGGRLELTALPVIADNLNLYNVDVRTPDGTQTIANPYSMPGAPGDAAYMDKYLNPNNQRRYTTRPGQEVMQCVDNLPLFSAQVGVYGSLPVSRRCALGAKVLVGQRIAVSCKLNGYQGFIEDKDIDKALNGGKWALDKAEEADAARIVTSTAYESIDLNVKNSFVVTTGINFTMMLHNNMGCKLFVDYSNSGFDYDLTYSRTDMSTTPGSGNVQASSSHKRSLDALSGGVALQLQF